jgi:hypothetical protein
VDTLVRAVIVGVDPDGQHATVRLDRDGLLLRDVRVNAATAAERLVPGNPCLVAVLDDDALLVTTRIAG